MAFGNPIDSLIIPDGAAENAPQIVIGQAVPEELQQKYGPDAITGAILYRINDKEYAFSAIIALGTGPYRIDGMVNLNRLVGEQVSEIFVYDLLTDLGLSTLKIGGVTSENRVNVNISNGNLTGELSWFDYVTAVLALESQGTLTVAGTADIGGRLTAAGATINGTLTGVSSATVNNLTANSNITAKGTVTTANLTVTGTASIPKLPQAMDAGSFNWTGTLAAGVGVLASTISFAAGRFTSAPNVVCSLASAPGGSAALVPRVINASTTNGQCYIYNTGAASVTVSSNLTVNWHAVLM